MHQINCINGKLLKSVILIYRLIRLFCSIVAASKLIAFDLSNHKGLLSDILHQIVRQCSAVGHFTVVGLVTLLLRESEAEVDLVLIQTFFLLQF